MGWNIGTKRGKARQKRREDRRQARKDKKQRGVDRKSLGGSAAEEKRLYDQSVTNSAESRSRIQPAFDDTKKELDDNRRDQDKADSQYQTERLKSASREVDANQSIDGINLAGTSGKNLLGTAGAAAQGEYTGGADSAISTRANALANGSLVNSTEQNILANRDNAQAQQRFSQGLINNGAMGLAAGQGESGALALQSAMSGATNAAGTMAAQQNLALADQNAQLRLAAAAQERQNQLGFASDDAASLEAAAAARAGVGMNVAGAQADLGYNAALATTSARQGQAQITQAGSQLANQRDLALRDNSAGLATNNANLAVGASQNDQAYQADLLATKYAAQQGREQKSKLGTAISTIFDPMDIRGSGSKGVGL